MFQFNIVLGILLAYVSNSFILGMGDEAWRWMLGVEAIPALLFCVLVLRVPRSPRWLYLLQGKEEEAREFKKEKFGVDGELFKKRKELIKPIQEKIYTAVQQTASIGKYAMIFDKAGEATMVYTNPKYDKSDDILRRMGYKPGGK